jgi:hypothetical protein
MTPKEKREKILEQTRASKLKFKRTKITQIQA